MGDTSLNLSIIVPVFNGEETLKEVLDALFEQEYPGEFEIIAVNDKSTDRSSEILKEFESRVNFRVANNPTNLGQSQSLNFGILQSKYDIILLVEQDCFPIGKDCIKNLINSFQSDDVVGSIPAYVLPKEIWQKYDFWWQLWFARLINKKISNLNLKFDAFRKSAFLKIGLLDYVAYRNSGQDVDTYVKLSKIGRIVKSTSQFRHYHGLGQKGSIKKIIQKEMQYGESCGVLVRKYFLSTTRNWEDFAVLSKPVIVFGSLIPFIQFVCVPTLIFLSFFYKFPIYRVRDKRLLIVPLVNFASVVSYSFYFLVGLIRGKQTFG